jgi:PBP1b-binding outer membrane lipoprotein LpoB
MRSQWIVLVTLALASCARSHSDARSHSESDAASTEPSTSSSTPTQSARPMLASALSSPASHRRAPRAKEFVIVSGLVELRGALRRLDARTAEIEVVLDARSATRPIRAQYNYRLNVELERAEAKELAVGQRRMYALVPAGARTWSDLLSSDEDLSQAMIVVRLDGAGEED